MGCGRLSGGTCLVPAIVFWDLYNIGPKASPEKNMKKSVI